MIWRRVLTGAEECSGRGLALAVVAAMFLATPAQAAAPREAAAPGKVVVAGVVPDEATRQAILARTREIYGADRVVDQIGVSNLVAPPNWAQNVQKLITPDLKRVVRGQLKINGNVIDLTGEVDNEASRQQVVSLMSSQLNPTYTVRNGLRVAAAGQEVVDAALANRIIEFEAGNSTLTPNGVQVLDQLLPVLRQLTGRKFEVIGHTDAQGGRSHNIALSAARADAVKAYLQSKGISGDLVQTSGVGPDRPVAGNDTAEGRARNRRIEMRVMQ
jgi:OOP family OmpA-OmpF porin